MSSCRPPTTCGYGNRCSSHAGATRYRRVSATDRAAGHPRASALRLHAQRRPRDRAFLILTVVTQRNLPPNAPVDTLASPCPLSPCVRFTVLTILWWIERIVITDKRVMLAEGFIVNKIAMMPLSKVTDLTFERSLRGRLLGYGTLIVESAGQIQALNRIDYVPRPEEVYEALSELVFGEKGRTRATGMLSRSRWRR